MDVAEDVDPDDFNPVYEVKAHAVNYVNEAGYAQSLEFATFKASEVYRAHVGRFEEFVRAYERTRTGIFGLPLLDYRRPPSPKLLAVPPPLVGIASTGSVGSVSLPVKRSGAPTAIDPTDEKCRPAREARGSDIGKTCYAAISARRDGTTRTLGAKSAGTSYLHHAERVACQSIVESFGLTYASGFQSDAQSLGRYLAENRVQILYIYTEYPPCPSCDPWTANIGADAVYYSDMFESTHFQLSDGERDKRLAGHLRAIGVIKK